MTIWICSTCGLEHPNTSAPPSGCAICSDDRQWVPAQGQQWTTFAELSADRTGEIYQIEPDLSAVVVRPSFAIGQRGLLVHTEAGNLLWEPPGYLDDEMIGAVRKMGGLAAIAGSHPHLAGCSVSWSAAFGDVPVYHAELDRRWVRRPADAIRFYRGVTEILPGLTLVPCGGHFPGSAVLHWPAGAAGRGVLLSGDTVMVNPTLTTVSFMRSYPNLIPLPERLVNQIVTTVTALTFDRIYGGFEHQCLATDAHRAVRSSAERYLGWLRDEIRDPDDPGADPAG